MKLIPTVEECSNIILGAYAGASFYNTFDKVIYDKNAQLVINPINISTIEKINELLTKIQSHWNKQNSHDFQMFACENMEVMNDLLENPWENYKNFILSFSFKGIQNTKISKILHILKPNEFPMLDPEQGKFLIGSYKKDSKEHLVKAIETFFKYHNNNLSKTRQIEKLLVGSYGIKISCLRVFELLLWIQTQLTIKGMTKIIIKKDI